MDWKELFIGLATKAYNKTDSEITSLVADGDTIKDTALQTIIELDAQRVTKLKGNPTEKFNDGFKKGQKETAEKFESSIKELAGIDSDKTGDDLISEVRDAIDKGKKPSKLTDEEVKKHALYLAREKELKKAQEEAVAKVQGEFDKFKTDVDTKNMMSGVRSKVKQYFNESNAVISSDPTRAANQMDLFMRLFDDFKYQSDDKDEFIILKPDGTRLENDNGHPVKFKDFVTEKIKSMYDLKKQTPAGGTGNNNGGNGGQGGGSSDGINMFPKTDTEFIDSLTKLEAAGTDEARKQIVTLHDNFSAKK